MDVSRRDAESRRGHFQNIHPPSPLRLESGPRVASSDSPVSPSRLGVYRLRVHGPVLTRLQRILTTSPRHRQAALIRSLGLHRRSPPRWESNGLPIGRQLPPRNRRQAAHWLARSPNGARQTADWLIGALSTERTRAADWLPISAV